VAGTHPRQHRVYFALWPAEDVRAQIATIAREWVDRSVGRAIRPENFHMTLAFLGSVSDEALVRIREIAASLRAPPFEFALDRIETWKAANVLCLVATQPAPTLLSFATRLRFSLLEQQPELSRQDFRAHVTLARQPVRRVDAAIGPVIWPVSAFVLVESGSSPQGSEYRIAERWPLRE
jgi:2'-5' RNA ligase